MFPPPATLFFLLSEASTISDKSLGTNAVLDPTRGRGEGVLKPVPAYSEKGLGDMGMFLLARLPSPAEEASEVRQRFTGQQCASHHQAPLRPGSCFGSLASQNSSLPIQRESQLPLQGSGRDHQQQDKSSSAYSWMPQHLHKLPQWELLTKQSAWLLILSPKWGLEDWPSPQSHSGILSVNEVMF